MFKKIMIPVLSGILFSSTVNAQVNNNNFLSIYDEKLKSAIQSYSKDISAPLDAKIFDISHPFYYRFLNKSTHREYRDHFLAMMYYKDFQVNGKQTNFCFILYDNKRVSDLEKYLNKTFPKPEDAVDYLVIHELGHCIASHQRELGKISEEPNRFKEEQIADIFSIAYFISHDRLKEADAILNLIKNMPKEDIHANYKELKQFYDLYKDNSIKHKDIFPIFEESYHYYLKIHENN